MLVDFSGTRDLARFMRAPATPGEILKRWIECPLTTAYESGRISASLWAERFVREWDLNLKADEFLAAFTAWLRGFFPGAKELLAELRPCYRLAALSNSNELHWKRNDELGITREFEFALASHELGCCKPDPAIFRAALDKARLAPDAVMFFDDQPPNVAAALSCGIRAFQVEGVAGVRECLVNERLLLSSRENAGVGQINVRPVTEHDSAVWLDLRRALWPEHGDDSHAPEIRRFFAGELKMPLGVLLAEDENGHILGFVELSIRAYAEGCITDRVAFLEGWYVMPKARQCGVGRKLVAAAEEWARAQGCTEFASDAVADNHISAEAHLALGFEEVVLIRCFRKRL